MITSSRSLLRDDDKMITIRLIASLLSFIVAVADAVQQRRIRHARCQFALDSRIGFVVSDNRLDRRVAIAARAETFKVTRVEILTLQFRNCHRVCGRSGTIDCVFREFVALREDFWSHKTFASTRAAIVLPSSRATCKPLVLCTHQCCKVSKYFGILAFFDK